MVHAKHTHAQAHSQGTSGGIGSSPARRDAEVRDGGPSSSMPSWVLPLMAGRAHVTFCASSGIRLLSSNSASATYEEAAWVTTYSLCVSVFWSACKWWGMVIVNYHEVLNV